MSLPDYNPQVRRQQAKAGPGPVLINPQAATQKAEAQARLGRSLVEAHNLVAKSVIKMNRAKAAAVYRALDEKAQKWKEENMTRRRGPLAAGFYEDAQDWWDEQADTMAADLSDSQREVFGEIAKDRRAGFLHGVARHQTSEIDRWGYEQVDGLAGREVDLMAEAIMAGDDDLAASADTRRVTSRDEQQILGGHSPVWKQTAHQQDRNKAAARAMDATLKGKRWAQAERILETHGDWLNGEQKAQAQKRIEDGYRVERIGEAVDAAFLGFRGDLDGALDAVDRMPEDIRDDVRPLVAERFRLDKAAHQQAMDQVKGEILHGIMDAKTLQDAVDLANRHPDADYRDHLIQKAHQYHPSSDTAAPRVDIYNTRSSMQALNDIHNGRFDSAAPDAVDQHINNLADKHNWSPSQMQDVLEALHERQRGDKSFALDPSRVQNALENLYGGELPRPLRDNLSTVMRHMQDVAKRQDWKSYAEANQYVADMMVAGEDGMTALTARAIGGATLAGWRPDMDTLPADVAADLERLIEQAYGDAEPNMTTRQQMAADAVLNRSAIPTLTRLASMDEALYLSIAAAVEKQTGQPPQPWQIAAATKILEDQGILAAADADSERTRATRQWVDGMAAQAAKRAEEQAQRREREQLSRQRHRSVPFMQQQADRYDTTRGITPDEEAALRRQRYEQEQRLRRLREQQGNDR